MFSLVNISYFHDNTFSFLHGRGIQAMLLGKKQAMILVHFIPFYNHMFHVHYCQAAPLIHYLISFLSFNSSFFGAF